MQHSTVLIEIGTSEILGRHTQCLCPLGNECILLIIYNAIHANFVVPVEILADTLGIGAVSRSQYC